MNGRTDPVNYFGKQQPHLVDCSGYSSYNEQQSQGTVSPSHVLQHTYQGNQQPGTISGNFGTSYTDTLKSVSQSVRYHPYHHLQQEQQHNNYVDTSSSSQIQVNYAQHQYSNSLPTSYPIHHQQQVNCCFNDLGGSQQNGSSNFICTSTASYNGNNCNNIEAQALYSGIGSSNAYQTTYQQFSTTKETFTGGSNFQTNCWPSEYKDLAVHPHSTGGFQRTGFLCPQIMDESASSPEVEFEVSPEAKKKGPKKRKKKGANEPQKPVSAYALFFRDTQAAIKAENPNATFGEISKIVASMWDSLSEEAKQVYKQKTETAKRDYLKQLAAYRANLVSRGGLDVDDDSQPLSVLKMQMKEVGNQRQPSLPPMPKLQIAPSRQREWSSMNIPETNLSTMRQNDVTPCPDRISPIPTAGTMTSAHQGIILSSQVNSSNISPSAGSSCVGPPPIQLRNMVPKATSPIAFFPSKPGQVIKVLPASQAASITSSQAGRSRIIKMADMLRPVTTTASRSTGEDTCSVQPILQMLAQESEVGESEGNIQSEPGQNDIHGKLEYVDLTQLPTPPALLSHARGNHQEVDSKPVQMCIRDGCNNFAVSDPQWNDEYCSSECVVTHCRDVFDAWASTRKISASVN